MTWPYILTLGIFSYVFIIISKYDKTLDPKVPIGQCELISRFSDFALYLGTQLVYYNILHVQYDWDV